MTANLSAAMKRDCRQTESEGGRAWRSASGGSVDTRRATSCKKSISCRVIDDVTLAMWSSSSALLLLLLLLLDDRSSSGGES